MWEERTTAMPLRLALYSDQEIAANAVIDERLLRLIGVPKPKIGFISSAPDPQRGDFEHKRNYYKALGADLSRYLDAETIDFEAALAAVLSCDAVHLSGGNTYS